MTEETQKTYTNPKRKPPMSKRPLWSVDTVWCEINNRWCFIDSNGNYRNERGRFVPGRSGNSSGTSSEVAKRIQQIRDLSTEALLNHGLPRLIKFLSHEKDISVKDLVGIVNTLGKFGVPQLSEIPSDSEGVKIPNIVISTEAIERAKKLDDEYNQHSDVAE